MVIIMGGKLFSIKTIHAGGVFLTKKIKGNTRVRKLAAAITAMARNISVCVMVCKPIF